METPGELQARKRSHVVAYSTMFIMSIGFSIILSGVWPYLQELSPGIEKAELGFILAANPLGQLIASPLLGLWGNKRGSIRIPCLVTVVLFILGNVLYAILGIFGKNAYMMMLFSRLVVGVSTGNITLLRSYVVSSTTIKERTGGIAIMAGAQILGLVFGAGIQTILTLSIPEAIDTGIGNFTLDKYTATGWVAAVLGIFNCGILMPGIFKEHNIAEKEQATLEKKNLPAVKLPKPDVRALIGVLFGFFVALSVIISIETISTPFLMDQYGWNEDFAVVVVGVYLFVSGIVCMFMFALSSILSKKFDERNILLIFGFIPLIIACILHIPFTGEEIVIQTQCYNQSSMAYEISLLPTRVNSSEILNTAKILPDGPSSLLNIINLSGKNHINNDSLLNPINNLGFHCSTEYACACGCPASEQPWCVNTKALPIPQLIIASSINSIGYPVVLSITPALYSKIVGPRPQGLWMGILTSVGSLSRILGPPFVSNVYAYLGTIVMYILISTLLVMAGLQLILIYKRVIPIKAIEDDRKEYELNEKSGSKKF